MRFNHIRSFILTAQTRAVLLSGFLLAVLFLSGCAYKQTVDIRQIALNGGQKPVAGRHQTIYAVSLKQFGNIITVKKFGISPLTSDPAPTQVRIHHGLAYELHHKDISTILSMELNMLMRKSGYVSVDGFIETYAQLPPLFDDSPFKAVPDTFGRALFDIAGRSDHDMDPLPIPPAG